MDGRGEHIYTPTELNREVRLHLEAGFSRVILEAEISNLSRPRSGHLYFTLKDEKAQVRCALFRSAAARMTLEPENGMKVLARGRVSLYEARGDYQLIVDRLQEAGEGALQREFEELKKRLEAEGLFDPGRKQALPPFPARIALITSPGGAALRDMLQVLERRWPLAQLRLYPVLVQGEGAAAEIRMAIEAANRHRWAELLIVGRGGGSLEDLMAFNDESVARAVSASALPVVSAVGHETDFSICDFVADLRAPTPSAAAELATPDQVVLRQSFLRLGRQLELRMQATLNQAIQGSDHLAHRLQQQHPSRQLAERARRLTALETSLFRSAERVVEERKLSLARIAGRLAGRRPDRAIAELLGRVQLARTALARAGTATVERRAEKLRELARTLNAVSPLQTVGRGYAVIRSAVDGRVISSISQTGPGDEVSAQLKDGQFDARVRATRSD
jgi:exodeoxyribonuclease VII large subunit